MQRFKLVDTRGVPVCLVEAADRVDAELYGHRNIPGYSRAEEVDTEQEAVADMAESFGRLGLNDEAAREAARGRDSGILKESIKKDPPRERAALQESFNRLGLSDTEAREAAAGRGGSASLPVIKIPRQEARLMQGNTSGARRSKASYNVNLKEDGPNGNSGKIVRT